MFDFITVCRALSDENRVRILMALRGRKLCVCQITAFLDLAPSTTSKHLSILRQARLIEGSKDGRWVYYRLATSARTSKLVRDALGWTTAHLEHDSMTIEDQARMEAILAAERAGGMDGDAASMCHSPGLHVQDPDLSDFTDEQTTGEA